MRYAKRVTRGPSIQAILALDGRDLDGLTPREDGVLEFYRIHGCKRRVAISIQNDADPIALAEAKSPEELKRVVSDAGGLRICVKA